MLYNKTNDLNMIQRYFYPRIYVLYNHNIIYSYTITTLNIFMLTFFQQQFIVYTHKREVQ